nr:MAG TPA: hypothetical protein [Caudoviricetes sp.]
MLLRFRLIFYSVSNTLLFLKYCSAGRVPFFASTRAFFMPFSCHYSTIKYSTFYAFLCTVFGI